jgi:unsaturated rhamnogalacturonyl hydrolase
MALSEMYRNPQAWMIDAKAPKWNYTQGLVLMAIQRVGETTKNDRYFRYVKSYADTMINADGDILTYQLDNFNIDHINPGKILFSLNEKTGEERYLKALQQLRRQLSWQPRTTAGGFWHKLRYPWQMWLDGLYMGAPFYAEYAVRFHEPEDFYDIARQFILMEEKARDPQTGLLYHGWDESRVQKWSDPETGLSPHFWGRAMGWYAMALVDVLDFMPADHPDRDELLAILDRLAAAVAKVQDKDSGLWYQVLDRAGAKGNYLEATASCMFVYSLAKAVNKSYLNEQYMAVAEKAYRGVLDRLIEVEENGAVNLLQCCAVAGLGGSPYRDGSYEYYVGEPVIRNDPKGTGPFILASLEMEKRSGRGVVR